MDCEIQKFGKNKYFLSTCLLGNAYVRFYHYVIKATEQFVVYRSFIYADGLYNRINSEDIEKKWRFAISKISDFPSNLTECYPLELVVLGLFRQPSKRLTKKQRQQIKDFEKSM